MTTQLFSTGPFQAASASSSALALSSLTSGNSVQTFGVLGSGCCEWSSGSAAADTFLYRSAGNTLAIGTSSSNTSGTLKCAEVNTPEVVNSAGSLTLAPSNGDLVVTACALDWGGQAYLWSSNTDTLAIGTTNTNTVGFLQCSTIFEENASNSTSIILSTSASNTSDYSFSLDSDGQLGFAPWSSNGARDTYIWRSAAKELTITDSSRGLPNTGNGLCVNSLNSGTLTFGNLMASGESINGNATYSALLCTTGTSSFGIQANTCALIAASQNSTIAAVSNTYQGYCNAIIGCKGFQIGDTTSSAICNNNVALGCNGGSTIIGAGSDGCLVHGTSFNITSSYGNITFFSDNGSGFSGTTTFGSGNIFQGAFQQGYYFTSNAGRSAGVVVAAGGSSWSSISDARAKKLLGKVQISDENYSHFKQMPIYRFQAHGIIEPVEKWEHDLIKNPDTLVDVGPTAQDFHDVFGKYIDKRYNKAHHKSKDMLLLQTKDELAALYLVTQKQAELIDNLKNKYQQAATVIKQQDISIKSMEARLDAIDKLLKK